MPDMSIGTATSLKDKGNALFGQRQLEKAVQAYSGALVLLNEQQEQNKHDDDDNDQEKDLLLYAVVCSNRSACYYEMGDYNHAAIDASACLANLDELIRWQHKFEHTLAHTPILTPAPEAKAVSMRSANEWRRTRALLYQHEGDLHQAQARLDQLELITSKNDNDDKNHNNNNNNMLMKLQPRHEFKQMNKEPQRMKNNTLQQGEKGGSATTASSSSSSLTSSEDVICRSLPS